MSRGRRDVILFVDRSSIRFWNQLTQDIAPLIAIWHRFGDAKLSNLVQFAEHIILPSPPARSSSTLEATSWPRRPGVNSEPHRKRTQTSTS